MTNSKALVVTSISSPNDVLSTCAKGSVENGFDFIVIGDVKSPEHFSLNGCDFWGIEKQRDMPFKLAQNLPEGHYARKNLGYLVAIDRGAKIIVETDDDNYPRESFWKERCIEQSALALKDQGWVNVYRHFSEEIVWPRGFPLEMVRSSLEVPIGVVANVRCPIQQGLADDNPDVDAVFRLIKPLPVVFEDNTSLALGRGCWSPFNSQNTTWFREAFPLLYIPSFCSFRMCDIWRSFVANRVCWENDWSVLFHGPTVYQERNEHDLLRDFRDEVPGYLNNAEICLQLASLTLKGGPENIADNVMKCYELLVSLGHIGVEEIPLLESWFSDVEALL